MIRNRRIIYLAGFLFSLPVALTSYINSSFLETYTKAQYVGIIFTCASIITIVGMLNIEKILIRFGNMKTTLLFTLLCFLALLILAIGGNSFFVIPAFIIYFVSVNFIIATLDIFIEDFSKSKAIGKMRGLYLTILNSAWVLAQIISGSIIAKSSYSGIYLFSAFFMVLFGIVFILFLRDFKDPKYQKTSFRKTLLYFLKTKKILKIYLINFILKFFYAWMIIYTTIYLHEHLLFNWSDIGTIYAIMLTPFVFLSYPLGKLSDKIGEKKMLIIGFMIISIFTFIIPFITVSTIWIWALVLFMTRIGASTIEVMSDNYFFKVIEEENVEAVGFFRNTGPLSFIVAPLLATLLFAFLPSFSYLFFVLTLILLKGLFLALRLHDVK